MRDFVLAIIYCIIFGLIALLFITWPFLLHASTTKKNNNSLGVLQYEDNPYTYKAGAVIAGYAIDGKALVIRVQPLGTYNLFTEDILFCDYPIDLFASKTNPMVLTYETRAHKLISGLGCHELIRADELKTKELP